MPGKPLFREGSGGRAAPKHAWTMTCCAKRTDEAAAVGNDAAGFQDADHDDSQHQTTVSLPEWLGRSEANP